jgi:dsDNA-binding SOS-regulon protein
MWKCDRDQTMFGSKKEADTHDKMLELAENFSLFLGKQIDGISEQDAENIGLLLSQNKDVLIAACKGNPDLLLNIGSEALP